MQLYKDPTDQVPPFLAEKYDREAHRYWDKFYNRNGANFFKDRHYLDAEFPELSNPGLVLLEVGCGAGNTIYPVLETHPDIRIFACDFAPKAVNLVNSHPNYDPERVTAFTADITTQNPFDTVIGSGGVDIVTMVFVLSAITPEKMPRAVENIAKVLKSGGKVLFRDYAEGDLAQVRLAGDGKQQRISTRFYVRGDGTCAYYFDPDSLRELFEMHGFKCCSMEVHERQLENRKKNEVMERRWIQAVFSLSWEKSRSFPSLESSSIKFTGAAGRLAANSRGARYTPQLPDSLDPADVTAAEISPATYGSIVEYEAELEREFASIVGQDTSVVVAEEVADLQARGVQACCLHGLQELEPSGGSSGGGPRFWGINPNEDEAAGLQYELGMPEVEPADGDGLVEVDISGTSVRLHASFDGKHSMVLGAGPSLARSIAESGHLLAGKTVLDLWCGGSPLCSLAAVKHASRVFASVEKDCELSPLRSNLRLNASQVIIERIEAYCLGGGSEGVSKLLHLDPSRQAGGAIQVLMCSSLALSQGAPEATAERIASLFRIARRCLRGSAEGMVWMALVPQSDDQLRLIDVAARKESYARCPACCGGQETMKGRPIVHIFEYHAGTAAQSNS